MTTPAAGTIDGITVTDGVWQVPSDGWWFPGHFPERPITPGVLVTHAATQALPGPPVVTIKQARFKGLCQPGDTVTFDADPASGKVRGRIDGNVNFDGVFVTGDPVTSLDVEPVAALTGPEWTDPDPAQFIPHRDPFLFLTSVDRVDLVDGAVNATWDVTGAEPFVVDGSVPPEVLIESAAQALAVLGGLRDPDRLMLFAAIRDARFVVCEPGTFHLRVRVLATTEVMSKAHAQVVDTAGRVVVDAEVAGVVAPEG